MLGVPGSLAVPGSPVESGGLRASRVVWEVLGVQGNLAVLGSSGGEMGVCGSPREFGIPWESRGVWEFLPPAENC